MLEIIAFLLFSHQPMPPMVEGMASYYTVRSSGTVTASGERLRDDSMTCAMLAGEFGDYVLVVAENGHSVVCRINDRGPFTKGRVIDLSKSAMRELHATADLLSVKVYLLGATPPPEISARFTPPH
jgi:rare lipoprotein A